jgi:hypothetical protein
MCRPQRQRSPYSACHNQNSVGARYKIKNRAVEIEGNHQMAMKRIGAFGLAITVIMTLTGCENFTYSEEFGPLAPVPAELGQPTELGLSLSDLLPPGAGD